MKYWPLRELELSPHMPSKLFYEIEQWRVDGSAPPYMYGAISHMTTLVQPRDGCTVLVSNADAPARRLCLGAPDFDEFVSMERSCVFEIEGSKIVHMDALH